MDNAPCNDVVARSLRESMIGWGKTLADGQHLHMRRAAQIINLIMTEGMKEYVDVVSRVRSSVVFVRRSTRKIEAFKEAASKEKITY